MGTPSDTDNGFKRVHFFKYFLTEDDWNARHAYHVQKNLLHMQHLHGEGIQEGKYCLRVKAHTTPGLDVTITPGLAIDNLGHVISVPVNETATFEIDKFQLPCVIYVKMVYQEMASDRVRLSDGRIENKYFRETYRFIVSDKPASEKQIELARVLVTEGCTAIVDAADPERPGPNEIDMTNRFDIPSRRMLDRDLQLTLHKLLHDRRAAFDRIGGNSKLPEIALLSQNFAIMNELLESSVLTESTVPIILQFFDLLDSMVMSSVTTSIQGAALDRPEWGRHRENCAAYHKILETPGKSWTQKLSMAVVQLEKISISYAHVARLLGNDKRVFIPGQPKPLPKVYPVSSNWEFIKTWSAEMPPVLKIDDMEWLLKGELNITDEASEKKYKFRICDARDIWKNRQRLSFPDGTLIEDTGVAQEGGYCEFDIPNVIPDTHLAIIRMIDYARGDYELMMTVNGQNAGVSKCEGHDRQARWRNWPFVIPSYFVNDTTLRVRQTCVTADRDVNMYRFWFYQPVNW